MQKLPIQVALDLINSMAQHDFHGSKSEAAIVAAEHSLGCFFPPSYRTFLKELGCGGFYGLEIYGLVSEDGTALGLPETVWKTKMDRADFGLPDSLVVVSEDGMGGLYVLDTEARGADGECPVRIWEYGPGLTEYVADSFGVFFLTSIQAELEDQ